MCSIDATLETHGLRAGVRWKESMVKIWTWGHYLKIARCDSLVTQGLNVELCLIYSDLLGEERIDSPTRGAVQRQDGYATETKIDGSVWSFHIEHLTNFDLSG
jgi:hypothetical protein